LDRFRGQEKGIAWVLPKASGAIEAVFRELGTREFFDSDEIVLHPQSTASKLYLIEKGTFSQAVVNYEVSKQYAMNLYFEKTVNGVINLFTGYQMPRLVRAVQPTMCLSIERQNLVDYFEENIEAYKQFAVYKELVAHSEIGGMVALFSLNLEDRFRLFFVSLLASGGYSFPSKHESNHVPLPFMLKRREVEQVIYASKVSLDRIFAKWYRNKWLMKKGEMLLVETSNLYPIYLWALAH
jgi:CRP-like cAMP-binding protein